MVYSYTDKQLNELNQGKNVYSVNSEYAEREVEKKVVSKTDDKLFSDETNTIVTPDGQEFRVIATKSDPGTGFDGTCFSYIFSILVLFIFKLQQNEEKEESLNE